MRGFHPQEWGKYLICVPIPDGYMTDPAPGRGFDHVSLQLSIGWWIIYVVRIPVPIATTVYIRMAISLQYG